MTNAEQFLEHYTAIERYLRRTYGSRGSYGTFLQLVTKASQRHSVIGYYATDLREYGELRNAIIHNRAPDENTIIAEPHSYVVERMAFIRKMIEDPLKIKDVMTSPVKTATVHDGIYEIAVEMFNNIYTHVPIYDGTVFKGILSESALLRWMAYQARNKATLGTTRQIIDMVDLLDQAGNKFNDYSFVPKNLLVLDARDRFEVALHEGRRLGAMFVTKTGKNTEPIEGIVTAWDLPKLELK